MIKSLDKFLQEIDEGELGRDQFSATDYPENWVIPDHSPREASTALRDRRGHGSALGAEPVDSAAQSRLLDALRARALPALRGPAENAQRVCAPRRFPNLPTETKAVSISPLLSELIKASVSLKPPYAEDSRDARVMRLILDELAILPALPLSLPQPADPRIQRFAWRCNGIRAMPRPWRTGANDWSLDEKTIQRLFRKETGMTFGQWRQQARLLLALERIAVGREDHRRRAGAGLRKPQRLHQHVQETVRQDAQSFLQVGALSRQHPTH